MRFAIGEPILADVWVSNRLDRLVITPRQFTYSHALSGVIRKALPGIRIHRSAEGMAIASQNLWAVADLENALRDAELSVDLRWNAEARQFVANRIRARQVHPQLYAEVSKIRTGSQLVAESYLTDINGLDVLDDHQWVNVAAMTLPESYGLCVFDEQGAGKTVTLIFAFDVLAARDEVDFALILAPKSMVPEWPCDFQRFKGDLYKVEAISGTRKQKRTALGSGADVLVTNFETAVSMEDELRSLLRYYQGRAMLVVDESFYIKNLDAGRTQALRRLREWCDRAFVLCGTPAPNAPQDLIQQFNIVDFGIAFDGVNIPDDRTQSLPAVQQAIEQRGLFIRHLKTDVLLDLPVKSFNRVFVPLQPEQERVYAAALRNLILDLQAIDAVRREAVRKFQEDNETMLFVANPAAAGAGLTLHRARLAIYESMSNQAAHYLQSLDRIHRRGQTRNVEYLILLCDQTIELQEYDRLTIKERAAQQLLRDRVEEPITRETMLQEAIAANLLLEES